VVESDVQQTDFRSIVVKYQEKVRNTCFRFVNNKEDADDVAQEVFIQVYESLGHFRQTAQLSTWIYRIAVNKSLDFIRKKKRKKRYAQLTTLFGFGEENEEIVIPSEENPHKNLENLERSKILNEGIKKLPENQQTAITLSKYEEFSNREVAGIMGISVSAVEALIHRAKKNLHKELYRYYEKYF
jgi:RNA polymerase sigma-70 factor (ECF subfamily)